VPISDNFTPRELADLAFVFYKQIKESKLASGQHFLMMGMALERIRDDKLYVYLDCKSFEEFLGLPELSMGRSTAFLYISIYDTFINKHQMKTDVISAIDLSKLQMILPVVHAFPEEAELWVTNAEVMSRTDLKKDVCDRMGKVYEEVKIKKEKEDERFMADYNSYVRGHACVACDNHDGVDPHHFPRTKGAGATDFEVMPLCRECHIGSHQDPHEFLIESEHKIFKYFYDTFRKAVEVLVRGEKKCSQ
jgi:hypothetical protein